MNVLSLFDGISGAQVALERAGVKVDNYYASEIDKHAIKVTQKNYPNTIQLGDINNWKNWQLPKIDLIVGGSPCQGFSFAGKQLNFKDTRSRLFFKFVEILRTCRSKYFILENVLMKKEYQDAITELLGVQPIMINSSLVSAQSRKRLYWCNFPVCQPEDKKIYLNHIIENGISARIVNRRLDENGKRADERADIEPTNRIETREDGKANCLTTVWKDSLIYMRPRGKNKGGLVGNGKCPTVTSNSFQQNALLKDGESYRKLTVEECEALQTYTRGYIGNVISKTQAYKSLGNSFTVDVFVHMILCMLGKIEFEYQDSFCFV